MQVDDSTFLKQLSKNNMETVIRIGLIAFLVVMCVYIFAPFMKLLLWSLILAIALYPLQQFLARRLKNRHDYADRMTGTPR